MGSAYPVSVHITARAPSSHGLQQREAVPDRRSVRPDPGPIDRHAVQNQGPSRGAVPSAGLAQGALRGANALLCVLAGGCGELSSPMTPSFHIATGAAGFIGSNIVKGLNAKGITQVLAVDNLRDPDRFSNLVDCAIVDSLDQRELIAVMAAG